MQLSKPVRPRRHVWTWVSVGVVVISLVGAVIVVIDAPTPRPALAMSEQSHALNTGTPAPIAWPQASEAAVGAIGYGVLATHGGTTPLPTASVAKIILAVALMREKPLNVGEQGPTITLTTNDVALYQYYLTHNGSVAQVAAGEQITEYQALEGLLLPSANNLAASLADWAFGSEDAYTAYANKMVADMGLTKTHVDDASGYSPQTVSTPSDLVQLGEKALAYPALAQIVSEKQATIPVAGTIYNVNTVLGKDDINGIKTGNTPDAGGCFLFSATRTVAGKRLTVVGAVQNTADLDSAIAAAQPVIATAFLNFVKVTALRQNQPVAVMSAPWSNSVQVEARSELSQIVWKGTPMHINISVSPGTSGAVGQATLGAQTTPLIMAGSLAQPSIGWRLTHPALLIRLLFTGGQ